MDRAPSKQKICIWQRLCHGTDGFTLVEIAIVVAITGIVLGAVFAFLRNVSLLQEEGITSVQQQRELRTVVDDFTRDISNADSVISGGVNNVIFFSTKRGLSGPYFRYYFYADSLILEDGVRPDFAGAFHQVLLTGLRTTGPDSAFISTTSLGGVPPRSMVELQLVKRQSWSSRAVSDEDEQSTRIRCYNRQ